MKKQINRINSAHFFHILPDNLNCAQAVLKGFQKEFDITDQEIEECRAWGGGRAEGGICGAVFSAERLLREAGKESIIEEFRKKAGSILCSDIKEKKFTCLELIRMTDELVEKQLK
jgi:hypothetical protein